MIGQQYLAPGRFVDSDSPRVIEFARIASAGAKDATDAALQLYSIVRDEILYDAYVDWTDPNVFRASAVLAEKRGFCVGKACLLAACARVLGVPSRLGFADVRNHMTSPRLYERMKTDVFRWHSYCELHLGGKWVKATPAFNASLCERLAAHIRRPHGLVVSAVRQHRPQAYGICGGPRYVRGRAVRGYLGGLSRELRCPGERGAARRRFPVRGGRGDPVSGGIEMAGATGEPLPRSVNALPCQQTITAQFECKRFSGALPNRTGPPAKKSPARDCHRGGARRKGTLTVTEEQAHSTRPRPAPSTGWIKLGDAGALLLEKLARRAGQ